jgi:hypothetical protein
LILRRTCPADLPEVRDGGRAFRAPCQWRGKAQVTRRPFPEDLAHTIVATFSAKLVTGVAHDEKNRVPEVESSPEVENAKPSKHNKQSQLSTFELSLEFWISSFSILPHATNTRDETVALCSSTHGYQI